MGNLETLPVIHDKKENESPLMFMDTIEPGTCHSLGEGNTVCKNSKELEIRRLKLELDRQAIIALNTKILNTKDTDLLKELIKQRDNLKREYKKNKELYNKNSVKFFKEKLKLLKEKIKTPSPVNNVKTRKPLEQNMGVQNRGDVQMLIYNLWIQWDIGKIKSKEEYIKKITDMYKQAFDNELSSVEGKESIINLKKYETSWKKIFRNELEGILGKQDSESLFLLSWVESNVQDVKTNEYGAIGYYQITPDALKDVNAINGNSYNNNDLSDPIKSAEIAAKHLKGILERIKRDYPKISKTKLLNLAITKYNGGLYTRLNKDYRTEPIETIFSIYKDLNWIKNDNKLNDPQDMINKLKEVQSRYYSKGKNHFKILDIIDGGKQLTKKQINKLIDNYIRKVLTQQNMYAVQFQAIKQSYLMYSNNTSYAKK